MLKASFSSWCLNLQLFTIILKTLPDEKMFIAKVLCPPQILEPNPEIKFYTHVQHIQEMKAEMFWWRGGDRRHESLPIQSLLSHQEPWGTCPTGTPRVQWNKGRKPLKYGIKHSMETGSPIRCPAPTEEVCEHGVSPLHPDSGFLTSQVRRGTSVMVSQGYFQLADSTALIP